MAFGNMGYRTLVTDNKRLHDLRLMKNILCTLLLAVFAVARGVAGAPGGTQVRSAVVPGTTADDPGRVQSRTLGVGNRTAWISAIPIGTPLPNIPVHVVKAPGVGRVLADVLRESAA